MAQIRYLLVVIVPILTFLVGWVSGQQAMEVNNRGKIAVVNGQENPTESGSLWDMWFGEEELSINPEEIDMKQFWTVWDHINKDYVDMADVSQEDMVYGAIQGLTESLDDPYSYFLPPQDTKDFNDSLNGDLEGIGAEISKKEGILVVVSPLKNSPAEEAGLQPGDVIAFIDEESTVDLGLYEAVSIIRGEPGTDVTLTIVREGADEPMDITITRAAIKVPSVTYEMKENDIAYVEINQFGGNTVQEFEKVVSEIVLKDPAGMILDLRYNGGGYLDGAVDIISFFIKEGVAVTVKMRNQANNEIQYVNGSAPLANIPLVVLINKGSASASEIVAGALQDYERGTIMGETSFGKGSVQELQPLNDGSSLRISVAKWYTPKDRNVNETGIEPDVTVEMTPEDFEADRDPQLDRALEFLKNKEYENQ